MAPLHLETAAAIERHRMRTFRRALWHSVFTVAVVMVLVAVVQGQA